MFQSSFIFSIGFGDMNGKKGQSLILLTGRRSTRSFRSAGNKNSMIISLRISERSGYTTLRGNSAQSRIRMECLAFLIRP